MTEPRAEFLTLSQLLARRLGTQAFAPVPDVVTVEPTDTELLPQNPNRLAAVLVNLGAFPLYVVTLVVPTTTRGIRIPPNGGSLTLIWDEDFNLTGYRWSALADGGSSSVLRLQILAA